ncbi:MAG: hypothetical protein QG646_3662 [Euryarchaeota archaeon]|nr:hypothetical protein [Euryarchaeota archaeon]
MQFKKPSNTPGFTIKMSLKLGFSICVVVIFSLVLPAAADNITSIDNTTATVHGEVYSLDTFEPLDNAVVYVNSTPAQFMVAKYGMYSFDLEPGNYTISAKYYQNSTVIYSVEDSVSIKSKGKYVHDLILLPVYSEELMGSSRVKGSSKNLTSSAGNPSTEVTTSKTLDSKSVNSTKDSESYISTVSYFLIALILVFLSALGYQISRKHKKIGNTHRAKTGHNTRDLSIPANTPELLTKVPDNSFDPKLRTDFQVYTQEPVSESKISVTESVIESKSKRQEEEAKAEESRERHSANITEHSEHGSEDENEKSSLEKLAGNHEIDNPDPKNKNPLPSDLQMVMEIIRDQNGRINQKDLCSSLRCSDAKVSLMLADLERRGLIEKFKKGRGNVVTLRHEEL